MPRGIFGNFLCPACQRAGHMPAAGGQNAQNATPEVVGRRRVEKKSVGITIPPHTGRVAVQALSCPEVPQVVARPQKRRRDFVEKKRGRLRSRDGNMPKRCNVNVAWWICRPWFHRSHGFICLCCVFSRFLCHGGVSHDFYATARAQSVCTPNLTFGLRFSIYLCFPRFISAN